MTKELHDQLAAAGYTEAQIAREAAYLARVASENERIRDDAAWNFGLHHASNSA